MFYIPNLPYAFYLAFRAGHPVFFSAANPGIKSSGNGSESKFETLSLIPKQYIPKSIIHKSRSDFSETILAIENEKIEFPFIVKPDVGFRGLLVQVIDNQKDLESFLNKYPIDFIIQEYIQFANECGIFFYKNPNSKTGKVTSITTKKFISVQGDGSSSIRLLISNDKRAKLYKDYLFEACKESLDSVPNEGEIILLSDIGNHSKGTQFINGNHLISESLQKAMNSICERIPGYFYGRMDLRFNSLAELEKGENLKILELNGIISEPTHIYDADKGSYFGALKSIRTHWKHLFEVSTSNHKHFKVPYKSPSKFISELFELRKYAKQIKKLHESSLR